MRLGFLDLLLVGIAVFTVWTRTPVGGLGQWGVNWLRGDDERVDLVSFFRNDPPPMEWIDTPVELPETTVETGFPEPYRTAVLRGLPHRVPEHTLSLAAPGDAPLGERLLPWLDEQPDPREAIERLALPDSLRDRAIQRAHASGEPDPERFERYRRYLPAAEEKRAARLIESVLALATVLDLSWPVDGNVRISSGFGTRVHPVLNTKKFHNGVDLPVPVGTPLRAAQAGRIVAATENAVSGKYVILEHAGGVRTAYCHLSELPAKGAGTVVERGELIGKSGNTGRSTGPHLHFVLRIDGKAVDPAPYRRVKAARP